MEIVALKRSGNGLSVCARCKCLGISYPVFWDSMLYDVAGLKGSFCTSCVVVFRSNPSQALPFLFSGHEK